MYKCDSSSVGRAAASQAAGRGFEPRLSLYICNTKLDTNVFKIVCQTCATRSFLGEPKQGLLQERVSPTNPLINQYQLSSACSEPA